MEKPVLMLHTIEDKFLNLKLDDYILTFDDGLYNHFYYYPKLKTIKTEKVFFISSNIIGGQKQSKNFICSRECHKKHVNGNNEDFMNLDQIKYLSEQENVFIGGHSHFHRNLNIFSNLKDKIEHIKKDTELMLEWFQKNLNLFPIKFCFPYNDDLNGLYPEILKKYGISEFFGKERIVIENII